MQRVPHIVAGDGVAGGLYVDAPREVLGNQANVGRLRCRCVSVSMGVISRVWEGSLGSGVESDIHTCQGCVCREDRVENGIFLGFRGKTIGYWGADVRSYEGRRSFCCRLGSHRWRKPDTYCGKSLPWARPRLAVANIHRGLAGVGNIREGSDPTGAHCNPRDSWMRFGVVVNVEG